MGISDKEYEQALANESYKRIMNKAARKFLRSIERDELEQLKMIALWKALESYSPNRGAKFTTYLYQCVLWECRTHTTNRKRHIQIVYLEEPYEEYFCYEKGYERVDMDDMLSKLPAVDKSILKMFYWDAMSNSQIAESLNTTKDKVKKQKALILSDLSS